MGEEVVKKANDGVGPLPRVEGLVNEVVHLAGDALTTHYKDGTFPDRLEVHKARLEWVVKVEDLLGKIEKNSAHRQVHSPMAQVNRLVEA